MYVCCSVQRLPLSSHTFWKRLKKINNLCLTSEAVTIFLWSLLKQESITARIIATLQPPTTTRSTLKNTWQCLCNHQKHPNNHLALLCCLRSVRKLSDLIKNILLCVPKMNEGLMGFHFKNTSVCHHKHSRFCLK